MLQLSFVNDEPADKAALGKILFLDPILSKDSTISCASCHKPAFAFSDTSAVSFGVDSSKGKRNTPSAMNLTLQKIMFWDGRAKDLEAQALMPIENPDEMNLPLSEAVHRLGQNEKYSTYFQKIFGSKPTKENLAQAIAAFERTLLSNQAPFQQYLRGKLDAMTILEKEGAKLFFGKAGCVNCHTGPALNSMQFNAIGLADMIDCPEPTVGTKTNDPANLGRGGFTGKTSDYYKFKVPQLYNLKDSPFYGHGSTLRSIRDVIVYKNNATPQNSHITTNQLDPLFRPLGLNNSEINAIEAFISNALYDSNLKRYVPDALPSGQCFPNSDVQSRIDLGCN